MAACKQVTIESNKRLSQSCIWETQKNYYIDKGIDAWSESVPFYITSNAFIANQYAQVIVAFIADWINQTPEAARDPFPILELGAGTGQLSYYLCTELKTQLAARSLEHVKIRYIVSDISDKNLDFIKNHPVMQELIKEGIISFSNFDAENDQTIVLKSEQNEILDIKNPLISISNYVLDSLSADVFYLKDGQIHESLSSLTTQHNNLTNNKPIDWEKVDLSYTNQPINENYYNDPLYNQVLKIHTNDELDNSYFVFPIGSLNAIKNLNKIGKNKVFNLFSDKAFNNLNELSQQQKPDLDVHGSFSMMVNLFAICEYNRLIQGCEFIPTARDGLTTAVICNGIDMKKMPQLTYQLKTCFENFSPTDFYNLYDHLSRDSSKWKLPELVSMLALSCWDPGLYQLITNQLQDQVENSDSQVIDRLTASLPEVIKHFYYVPSCDDTIFSVANIYYTLEQYKQALCLYEISNTYFPDEYETQFNIGLCYYYLEKYETSIQYLEQALTLNSKASDCRAQIKRAQKKLSQS